MYDFDLYTQTCCSFKKIYFIEPIPYAVRYVNAHRKTRTGMSLKNYT